jgi:hypothetical protein
MPDLKSELSKVISSWDNPTPPVQQTQPQPAMHHNVTSNVTLSTFNYVRDNPGKTRTDVAKALILQGCKKSSTTSLLGVMVKQGYIRETQGLLYTNIPAYKPLKSSRAFAKANGIKLVPRKSKAKVEVKVEAPAPAAPAAPQINSAWDAETLLNHLSIKQARALYDELRTIFGG